MFQNPHQIQTSDVVKNTFKIPKISNNTMFQKPHQIPGSDAFKNYQHAFLKFCSGSETKQKPPNFKKQTPKAKRQKYILTSFLKISCLISKIPQLILTSFFYSSSSSRRDSSSTSATVTGSGGSSSLSKSNSKQDVHRSRKSSISSASPKLDVDKKKDKVVRDMTTKGFKDALKLKLAKQDDNEGNEIKMEDDKLEELVKAIEKEMYLLYNRDAGTKYKAKYR